ncbi:MAG: Inositol-1-monophosphatase [Candidatus Anoxychlamydiales bacterium]|nr:Inositol-1-monophosphatase [Candidatus Anoxychlamydiales bacterium]
MDWFENKDFSKITKSAIEAALEAGDILKSGFRSNYKIEKKEGKHNLVTQYDLLSEKAIISYVNERFEDHSILCEEEGEFDKKSEYKWIIDPLDGTVNFAHSIAMFAVSIAVAKKDEIISAVTFHPIINELFVAEKSKGAFLNGEKLSVTNTKKLDDAFLSTGFPYDLQDNPNNCQDRFIEILKLGLPIRRIGAASLDLAYVAAGRFDVFWETGLGPWDLAAGKLLIEEAQGKVTHYDGSKVVLQKKNAIVASNKHLHDEFLTFLNKI